jgi:DnaJ domain/Domain of unknown function (DUF4388)
VRIAGRLSDTTLGDVLAALWRARLTGLVRLTETAGPTAGHKHGIYLREGQVIAVDTALDPLSSGDSAWLAGAPRQLRERVEALFQLREAALSFHVACPPPRGHAPPLAPGDYLRGRPRARDRYATAHDDPRAPARAPTQRARMEALSMLGLTDDASVAEVTRAFRERAAGLHPDRRPTAPAPERRSLEQRFAALSAAYHALIR